MYLNKTAFKIGALALLTVIGTSLLLHDPDSPPASALNGGDVVVVTDSNPDALRDAVPDLTSASFTSDFSEAVAQQPDVLVFDSTVVERAAESRSQLRGLLLNRGTVVALNVPLAVLESVTDFASLHELIVPDEESLTNVAGYDEPFFSYVYLDYVPGETLNWSGKGQKEIDPYLSVHLPEFTSLEAQFNQRRASER